MFKSMAHTVALKHVKHDFSKSDIKICLICFSNLITVLWLISKRVSWARSISIA